MCFPVYEILYKLNFLKGITLVFVPLFGLNLDCVLKEKLLQFLWNCFMFLIIHAMLYTIPVLFKRGMVQR